MSQETKLKGEPKTTAQAVGYIGGAMTAIAQTVMPVRMWLTLICSVALLITVFGTDSLLTICRAVAVYVIVMAVLLASAVFHQR